jgi:hypothetical protein
VHHITYQHGLLSLSGKEGGQDNLAMFFLKLIVSQFVQLHFHHQETLLFCLFFFFFVLFCYVDSLISFKISENLIGHDGKRCSTWHIFRTQHRGKLFLFALRSFDTDVITLTAHFKCTGIPRLTKNIRFVITFVSRNVIFRRFL